MAKNFGAEVQHQFDRIFIPENKQSCWVYKKGTKNIVKDTKKEHQGIWAIQPPEAALQSSPTEVWIFFRDLLGNVDCPQEVLEDNPNQGQWAYTSSCTDIRKAQPDDMRFYPPDCTVPSKISIGMRSGIWVKPEYKRDLEGKLERDANGFVGVSGKKFKNKGGKLGVKGGWKMLAAADKVVTKKVKPNPKDIIEPQQNMTLHVREPNGNIFDIIVLPYVKIRHCKDKIETIKPKYPAEDQRLYHNGILLVDDKTVVGSNIKDGDYIDIAPMDIYVRRLPIGKKYLIENVDPEETISNIKLKIQDLEGTPIKQQTIYYKRTKLTTGGKKKSNNPNTLAFYGIKHQNVIDLVKGMIIYVETNQQGGNQKLELDVEPTDTVLSVKKKVQTRCKMPISDQTLYFNGKKLHKDENDLESYMIQHMDTLVMTDPNSTSTSKASPTPSTGMCIYIIQDWDAYRFTLDNVTPNDLISTIKERIEQTVSIPIIEQRLSFKGKSVYNTKTLVQCKIKNKSILHLAQPKTFAPKPKTIEPKPKPSPSPVTVVPPVTVQIPEFYFSRHPNGKITIPKVSPTTTPDDIKNSIEKQTGIPKHGQRLFYIDPDQPDKEVPLDDQIWSSIPPGSVVSMKPPEVTIQDPKTNTPRVYFFDPDDTVKDVKDRIRKKTSIPIGDGPMIFNGQPLDDDDLLINHNPKSSDVITVEPPPVEIDVPGIGKIKLDTPTNKIPTIKDLKDLIEDGTGIPKRNQRLFFLDPDQPLDDDILISQLPLSEKGQPPIQMKLPEITVKTPDGKTRNFIMDPEETVKDFKERIAPKTKLNPDTRFMKNGKPLDDDDPMTDLDHGDVLTMGPPPEVEVDVPGFGKVKLDSPNNPMPTLGDLKDLIEEGTGIPKRNQRLFFLDPDQPLDDDTPLSQLPLSDKGQPPLQMKLPELTVKTPDGKTRNFIMDPEETVKDFKERIVPKTKLNPDTRLLRNGKPLDDDDPMTDLDHGDVLTMGPPPEVEVDVPGFGKVKLDSPNTPIPTLGDLKDLIEEGTGIPKRNQRLFFLDPDQPLDDDTPLSQLPLSDKGQPPIQMKLPELTVKTPDGKTRNFIMDPEETVKDFKKRIAPKTNFNPDNRILRNGKPLDDDDPMADLDHGDVLTMGPPPEVEVDVPGFGKVKLDSPNKAAPTLGDLKDAIEEGTGIPKRNQRLFFLDPDQPLDDDTPLSQLPLSDKGQPPMQMKLPELTVKTPDGKTRNFFMDPEETVKDFKKRIAPKTAFNPDSRLLRNGDPLDDDDPMTDLDHGDVLTMGPPPEVEVDVPDVGKVKFAQSPNQTIGDLKDLVEEGTGIPKRNQRLFFLDPDQPLDDDTPLSQLPLGNGDDGPIRLQLPELTVKTPDGKTRNFIMDPEETVKDFKKRIAPKTNFNPDNRLLKNGKPLDDDDPMTDLDHGDFLTMGPPPEVEVDVPEFGKVKFDILPAHTISDVKAMVEEGTGIPRRAQRLFNMDNEEELDDKLPLGQAGIKPDKALQMKLPELHVKTPDNTSRSFIMDPHESVEDFKKRVADKLQFPEGNKRLFLNGEPLDDDALLSDLSHGDVLTMEPDGIEVETPDGKFTLSLLPTHTLDEMKDIIEQKTGVPKGAQRLFFLDNEKELDGNTPLSQTGILEDGGAPVQMQLPELHVSTPGKPSRSFIMDPHETVDDFKNRVADKSMFPLGGKRLVLDGEPLDDDAKLSDCGAKHGDVLSLEDPQIDVEVSGLGKVKLNFLPTTTFGDIKNSIQEETGIPRQAQRIFFMDNEDEELDDDTPLSQTGIKEGKSLQMGLPELHVETPGNPSRSFIMDPHESVEDFKKRVAGKTQIPLGEIRLFANGEELDDDEILSNCNLKHGEVLSTESPEVDVEVSGLGKVKLNFLPTTTFGDIKDSIQEETGIPRQAQRIFFMDDDGTELDDSLPLSQTALKEGRAIKMELPELHVETRGNPSRSFIMDPHESVGDFKKRVAGKTQIPLGGIRLFLNGEELEDDDEMLSDCNLTHGDVLTTEAPEVDVEVAGLGKVKLNFLPTTTFGDLKDMIEEEMDVPKGRQRLFFLDSDGAELDDDLPLSMTQIKEGAALELRPPEVEVKTSDGRTFVVIMDFDDTIDDVKRKVKKATGLKVAGKVFDMRLNGLVFDEEDPDDVENLNNLKHGDVLTLDAEEVEFALPDNRKIKFSILPTTTLEDIMDLIEEEVPDMSVKKQREFFFDLGEDEELDEKTPFKKIKFNEGVKRELFVFEITVQQWNADALVLGSAPTEYIDDLKDKIEEITKIPVDHQSLTFEGHPVSDDLTLKEQNIVNKSTLVLEPTKIRVVIPDGEELELLVSLGSKIDQVKQLVFEEHAQFPVDIQCLMFGGEELLDGRTLSECGVDPDDVLSMEVYEIKAMHWSGDVFAISDVNPNDMVEGVKNRVASMKQIAADKMRFTLEATPLDERMTLKDQGVKHKSILVMEEAREIEIKVPRRAKFNLSVFPTTTIAEVKYMVEEEVPDFEIAAKQQLMFFLDQDEALDDNTPLQKLKFERGLKLEVRPFEITVQHWSGDTFTIEPDPTEYVDDLKDRIEQLRDIPIDQQHLTFNGEPLSEDLALRDQNIVHQSLLILEPMKILLEMPDGEEIGLVVDLQDSIRRVKDLLFNERSQYPVDVQCILLGGEELLDDRTLSECDVGHSETLKMEVFEIKVMHWFGEVFSVGKVHPEDTMESVKNQISEMKGISLNELRITVHGRQVAYDATLREQGIKHKSVLVLQPPDGVDISIPDGARMGVDVLNTATFKDVAEEDIMPIEPNWKKRIFFFDDDDIDDLGFIELSVMHWSGEVFKFDNVRLKEKIDDIKKRVFALNNAPEAHTRMIHNGRKLDDTKTLNDQKIQHKSILVMEQIRKSNIELPDADKIRFGEMFSTKNIPFNRFEKMTILVEHWKGDTFTVEADPTEYSDDLKDRIEELRGIPVDQQRLAFKGHPLSDELTLKEQKIVNQTTLVLEPMKILVEVPGGEDFLLVVDLDDKIERIKELIFEQKSQYDVDVQCILFGGVELTDDQTLSECDVDHEDLLNMEVFGISVMHWSGEIFAVTEVLPSDSINIVKTRVAKLKEIPEEQQRFSFEGSPVDDEKSLKDQRIKHKSILVLSDPSGVKVNAPKREKFRLSVFSTPSASFNAKIDKSKDPATANAAITGVVTIQIKHWKGDTFDLEIDPTEYCDDVKEKIQKLKGIPVDQQRLTFQGKPVEESTLEDQNIGQSSTLVLEPMQIQLEMPDGRVLPLSVDLDDDIKKIKRLLFKDNKEFPVGAQCIMNGAEELVDDKTLLECNVDHEDTLTMEVFEISAMHWSGTVFPITEVLPTDKFEAVKKRVAKVNQIPKERQAYNFEGAPIDDHKTLKDHGIKHKSILIMQAPDDDTSESPKREKFTLSLFSAPTTTVSSDASNDTENLDVSDAVMANESGAEASIPENKNNAPLNPMVAKGGKARLLRLRVKHWDGEEFQLEIDSNQHCGDVKDLIQKLHKIPVDQQRLTFQGRPLQEDLTLKDQEIANRSTLALEPMQIVAKTPGEKEPTAVVTKEGGAEASIQKSKDNAPLDPVVAEGGKARLLRLRIKYGNGEDFQLEMDPSQRCGDVKDRIQKLHKIPVDQQNLTFQGRPLLEDLTLKDQKIENHSTLVLDPMQIMVKTPRGKELKMVVDLEYTIKQIKRLVYKEKPELPVNVQCIFFGGEEMAETNTLAKCKVKNRDVLSLEVYKISAIDWSGVVFAVEGVRPTDTLDDLKMRVARIKQIPKAQQRFMIEGKQLDGDLTLKSQGIKHNSVLTMEQPSTEVPKREKPKPTHNDAITIQINHWNGDSFALHIDATERCNGLTDRIYELKKIPVDQQRLTFQGQPLKSDATLKEQNIVNQSVIELEPMRIRVKTPSGEELTIVVDSDFIIKKLKRLVFRENRAFPVVVQCLMFGGGELSDDMTLAEGKVGHNDVLTLEVYEISVTLVSGEILVISGIRPNDTIDDVKKKITKAKQIPRAQQRFTCNGKKIPEGGRALRDLGIKHRSVLIMAEADGENPVSPKPEKVRPTVASTPSKPVSPKPENTKPTVASNPSKSNVASAAVSSNKREKEPPPLKPGIEEVKVDNDEEVDLISSILARVSGGDENQSTTDDVKKKKKLKEGDTSERSRSKSPNILSPSKMKKKSAKDESAGRTRSKSPKVLSSDDDISIATEGDGTAAKATKSKKKKSSKDEISSAGRTRSKSPKVLSSDDDISIATEDDGTAAKATKSKKKKSSKDESSKSGGRTKSKSGLSSDDESIEGVETKKIKKKKTTPKSSRDLTSGGRTKSKSGLSSDDESIEGVETKKIKKKKTTPTSSRDLTSGGRTKSKSELSSDDGSIEGGETKKIKKKKTTPTSSRDLLISPTKKKTTPTSSRDLLMSPTKKKKTTDASSKSKTSKT